MRKSTHSRKTFGFTSCGDILTKLERELARLDAAKTLEEAADHASNAAEARHIAMVHAMVNDLDWAFAQLNIIASTARLTD